MPTLDTYFTEYVFHRVRPRPLRWSPAPICSTSWFTCVNAAHIRRARP